MRRIVHLALKPSFRPLISTSLKTLMHVPAKIFRFSGGEEHIKLEPEVTDALRNSKSMFISHQMSSSSAVMQTLLATDAVRRVKQDMKINLVCPYFPYARQDRVMVPGEPLSVSVFAKLINSQKYHSVTVLDPHSDVTSALVDNINVIANCKFAKECLDDIKTNHNEADIVLVSPDAGAYKKIYNVATFCKWSADKIVTGYKMRDVTTGKITKTEFIGDVQGKVCVIIDDIIDGGRTFVELADILKAHGAKSVILVVTHGIFSNGFDCLKKLDKIYTTDSFQTLDERTLQDHNFVTQFGFKYAPAL